MEHMLSELQEIFRRVFDEDELIITERTTAADVNGWDSMAHINLIIAIEKRFGVRFAASELATIQGAGQNVGRLLELLRAKVSSKGAAV
jgi:acyl carrier protein